MYNWIKFLLFFLYIVIFLGLSQILFRSRNMLYMFCYNNALARQIFIVSKHVRKWDPLKIKLRHNTLWEVPEVFWPDNFFLRYVPFHTQTAALVEVFKTKGTSFSDIFDQSQIERAIVFSVKTCGTHTVTLCLDLLYCCTVILLSGLCTSVL